MNNYDSLIAGLDAFIRKYYANKVIRGTLIFLSCILFYFLSMSVGEYFLYLSVGVRVAAMGVFVILGLSALVAWVVIPLSKMARLGSVITHEQAAEIIGQHFNEVSDKLLNILQLKKQYDSVASKELIEASINQKIRQISVVPITSAIDLSKNKKYLPYLLPLLLIGVFLLIAAPNVFKEGTSRLLQPTRAFEKPAPFHFTIKNSALVAVRNTDFTLQAVVNGAAIPTDAYIEINGEQLPMQAFEKHNFQYVFRNMTVPVRFRIFAAGFYTQEYLIKVVQRPVLKSFKVHLQYPAYTGIKNEDRNSLSDISVPMGTSVIWKFETEHADEAYIQFGSGNKVNLSGDDGSYGYQFRFLADTSYIISLKNIESGVWDSFRYQVQVIPDQYPVLQLQQIRDTVTGKQIAITGTAGDDYSVTRVNFNYEVTDKNQVIAKKSIPLKINPGALCAFEHYFDVTTLSLAQGQKVSFFMEAWDNDGVHGSKATRSEVMSYQAFDAQQLDSAINNNAEQINSGLSNTAQQTKEMQSDYKDMQTKMLQSDNMDWEQQLSLQEMMKKQEELKNQLENIKQKFEEQTQQTEQKKYSDNLREKQDELKKQMDNLLNNELKEQMKKLQELMQKLNKDQAVETMKQMQQDNKLFNMDMQRMKELMAKMEQQMRMEDMANKMDELAKKENALNKETETGNKTPEELAKEQEKLKNELEKSLKEDMKDIEKLAEKNKMDKELNDAKKDGQDAQQDMQQSEQELQKNEKSKAGKSQKSAAQKLQKMAQSMRKGASGMDMQQLDIDIKATRQILSNLIRLSFDQEDLMYSVKVTQPSAQQYLDNQAEQARLRGNASMIKDSLFELSKRLEKLPVNINKTTTELEHHMAVSVDAIENRIIQQAVVNQQFVMAKTNDLALILNELLSNLMQMQSEGDGQGSMSMPGGKKPKPGSGDQLSDIITQQENLGSAMQQMQKSMGKKPGDKTGGESGDKPGNKPGEKGGQKPGGQQAGQQPGQGQSGSGNGGSGQGEENENGNAEQLARMAEQQASIRRKIQELASKLNSKGQNGASRSLRELENKMDRNETDLVNRRITAEMQARQREILTRLLEVEKTVREQEQDDKRSSKTPEDISRPIPPQLQKYLTSQKELLDLYRTVPPQLKPYYKNMVEQYFHIIGTK